MTIMLPNIRYKFKAWICLPQTILIIIIGVLFSCLSVAPIYNAAYTNGFNINILEPICFLLSSKISVFVLCIISASLFASGLFWEKNSTFLITRCSRCRFLLHSITFTVICIVLFYTIIGIAICVIFSWEGYLSNDWSEFTYYLTHTSLAQQVGPQILYFSSAFLVDMNPIDFLINAFAMNVLYVLFLLLIVFGVNMKLKAGNGFAVMMILHYCWSMMADKSIYMQVVSPFSHVLMGNHSFGYDYKPEVWESQIVLTGLVIGIATICGIIVKKSDLTNGYWRKL